MAMPMGFSPGLWRWPAPKKSDMKKAAIQKATARAWVAEICSARPKTPRVRVYWR